jgi:predicted amidohydrolase YtcJ
MKADLLFTNGPVYSGIHSKPFRFLAITANKILAIGRGTGKQYIGRNTEVVDLREQAIVPGIIDSHLHLLDYAWARERINLEPCKNRTEVVTALKNHQTASGWVLGRGWNREQFNGFPHKQILDELFPQQPVALNSRDGHFLWANSAAMIRAGLTRDTKVEGGYIGKDSSEEPDGIFGENAVGLIATHITKPDSNSRKQSILAAQAKLHQLGIVGLHSTDGNEAFGDLQDLHAAAQLHLRVFHSLPLSGLNQAVEIRMKSGFGDDRLRFGFVKIFSDGTLGSHSAAMLEPFEGTETTGMETISEQMLTEKVELALKNGIAVAVHAIGDRANRQTLNAFEKNSSFLEIPNAQSRIEHAQLLHPGDVPRFAKIGVVASMQPHHAISDHELAQKYWGPERCKTAYAWRSLKKSGANLIFGSDAPIENPDPLEGLRAAVHRWNWGDRSQTISALDALAAYTIQPAIASGEFEQKGSLEPGKLADLTLFSEDPILSQFQNCKVTGTVIDGRFVYVDARAR